MSELIECTSCQSENARNNKFCGHCGAKLPLHCHVCGVIVPVIDKFCGQCGAMAAAPAAAKPQDRKSEPEAERRQLTVMFCDLANSTALSEKLDPEDLRDIITRYQNACTQKIKKYNGYVARFMGDGILIYFGYPNASEDAAESAVRSGLEIITAIQQIKLDQDFELHVRLGIATGLVVAGDIIGEGAAEEHAVLGMTPNLAARLQSIAAPNTLVISARTRDLTGGFFAYNDLGKHDLKGISEPEQAWQVISEKEISSRFAAASEQGVTPLVGRREEISLLLNRWQRAVEGDGQVAVLFGEAGVGKSRIVEGFRAKIKATDQGTIFLSCSPFHSNSAFHPLIQCLRRVIGIGQGDNVDQHIAKLEEFIVRLELDIADVAPKMGLLLLEENETPYPPLSGSAEQIKRQIFSALLAVLEAQSSVKPMLLIVEDAHWIDPSTQEFLGILIDQLRRTPLLLIVAARPSFEVTWSGQPHVTTLMLNRLSRADSLAMIANVTGGKSLPGEVVSQIIERTDGIPLFVEELTKTVLESDRLTEQADQFILTGPLSELAIPSSLQDSLMARLDKLAPVKEVAQLAAVIGRIFDAELLASVSPLAQDELTQSLDELVSSELIFKSGMPPHISYEFKHALVQRAAYTSLLNSTRHRHHLKIAETLESTFPEVAEKEPEVIAHHFTAAEAYNRATAFWRKAGQRASSRWAQREAIGHFDQELDAIAKLPETKERAALEIEALTEKIAGQRILDRYDEALQTLDLAEAIATQYARHEDLSLIHYQRGNIYFPLGNIAGCLEQHELARQAAQKSNSPEKEAPALGGLGDAYYQRGQMRTANQKFHECITLSEANDLGSIKAANLPMRGHTQLYLLRLEQGLADTMAAAEMAAAENNLRAEMIARGSCSGKILFDLARYDEAKEQCEKAIEISKRLSARRFEPINQIIIAKVLALKGERCQALDIAKLAVSTSRETGFKFAGPMSLGSLAVVSNDPQEKQTALLEAEETLKDDCVSHNYLWFYRDAIDVSLALKDWDGVEKYTRAAENYTKAEPLPWVNILIERGRTLAMHYQNPKDHASIDRLKKLKSQILHCGFLAILPEIDNVLAP